ncbi:hypothetical protein PORY_001039 [Pneumocystis oryctolagi]|uniref:Uncharacterized protein n=1 Tax=Pneumocystis oryctolagi TaxID=42067 RepID=A0ACB7CEW2_9ASCO|nr:hypothetical protein PORY_001039 [Pneumocystis oryctolagi]
MTIGLILCVSSIDFNFQKHKAFVQAIKPNFCQKNLRLFKGFKTLYKKVALFYWNLVYNMEETKCQLEVPTGHLLQELRCLMKKNNIDIYIVPSKDAHSSEYISDSDSRRAFISGFDGSAGCAVISKDEACMFTDGRYFLQASQQLDKNWTLMKLGLPDVPTWKEWTIQQASFGKTVCVDASLISFSEAKILSKQLKEQSNSNLLGSDKNLIDEVWGDKRPKPLLNPVIVHPLEFSEFLRFWKRKMHIEFSGEESCSKISRISKVLEEKNAYAFLVTMLDDIAWLFNLRGTDIPYNPVFFAYALITNNDVVLYIDDKKLNNCAKKHLENVIIKPYENMQRLQNELEGKKVIMSDSANWALATALGEANIEVMRSPISDAKAIKNQVEVQGMRNCHIRDGVALVKFFAWLEEYLRNQGILDEVDAANQLEIYRKEQAYFMGLSFPTISSSGKNGAIIHYKPEKSTCSAVNINQIYLCDSGAQYRFLLPEKSTCSAVNINQIYLCDSGAQYSDGTTDVTRTYHFGVPTTKEKQTFTLVLKGHIAIAKIVFPKGTTGYTLDILARQHLWKAGLDYMHGTGHGIGSFLNVHEPPIGIAQRQEYMELPFLPGMMVSDEPGYYEDGCYGQRIESIIVVKEVSTPNNFANKQFYGFEYLTMCPIGLNLIDTTLLDASEKQWLNDYHALVLQKIGPLLGNDFVFNLTYFICRFIFFQFNLLISVFADKQNVAMFIMSLVSESRIDSSGQNSFFLRKTAHQKSIKTDENILFLMKTSIAGGISGCMAKTVIAPLDRVKILFQTSNPRYLEYSRMKFGFLFAGQNIWKEEGIMGLFQGHSVTLIRVFPYAAIKFLSYEKYRNILIPNPKKDTNARRFISGSLAGITSVLFTYPLEVIRVRLAFEVRSQKRSSFKEICKNIFFGSNFSTMSTQTSYSQPILKFIWNPFNIAAGLLNFYRGFTPTLLGILPYAGVSFCTHDFITDFFRKKEFEKYTVVNQNSNEASLNSISRPEDVCVSNDYSRYKRAPLKVWAELTAGGLAGLFSQTIAYPLEVIRRKMQVSDAINIRERKGIRAIAFEIWKTSGYKGFFVGLTISYVKAIPMISSSFFIYERLMHFFVS